MDQRITQLEQRLNSFDPSERRSALFELDDALARDEVRVAAGRGIANMLCRTFYSQDGHGHSPTGLAWLARKHGYAAAGIIDDGLDGVEEFLTACEMLGVRGSAGIAARVLVHETEDREEGRTSIRPRVFPVIGAGFAWGHPPASAASLTTPAENPTDLETFVRFVAACGALPCVAWQDGAGVSPYDGGPYDGGPYDGDPYDGSPYDGSLLDLAEEDGAASFEMLAANGVAAASIVPDSVDALPLGPVRDRHIRHLRAMVRAAADLDLPILVGSPSHWPGDPLAPDFRSPLLAPMTRAFMAGAYFIYGHTVMQRSLALGYQSRWAQEHLPSRRRRNDFYETIGRRVRPGAEGMDRLRRLLDLSTPDAILAQLS